MNRLFFNLRYIFKYLVLYQVVCLVASAAKKLTPYDPLAEADRWIRNGHTMIDLTAALLFLGLVYFIEKPDQSFKHLFSLNRVPLGILAAAGLAGYCLSTIWYYGIDHLLLGLELAGGDGGVDAANLFYIFSSMISIVFLDEFLFRGIILKRMLSIIKPTIALPINMALPVLVVVLVYAVEAEYIKLIYPDFVGQAIAHWPRDISYWAGHTILLSSMCVLLFYWTRSLWTGVVASLAAHLEFMIPDGIPALAAGNSREGAVMLVLILAGAIAASLVYVYKNRIGYRSY